MASDSSRGSDDPAADSSIAWLTPIRGHRTFEVIIDQLEAALLSGQLQPGMRLPSERELAAALDVSRASVVEALRTLEALGLVDVQRGPNGVSLRREPGDGFASILRLHLALGHYTPRSIVELRCVLESWSFAEAARSRQPEMLEQLAALLEQMAKPTLTPEEFNELDLAFHATVIDGCRNELAAMVLRGLRAVVRRQTYDGLLGAGKWSLTAKSLLTEHRELYQLMSDGDADTVERRVREHIQRWAVHAHATSPDTKAPGARPREGFGRNPRPVATS
jgi:GntR family transcriptional regulator, transcriptional repressor for pyruvate dehydrogenase complex